MNWHRNYSQTKYQDGSVETFDPLWCGHLQDIDGGVLGEIGIRGGWAIGLMWLYRVGSYSTYRVRFFEIGRLTLYVHLGMREPHNPRTGATYAD